MQIYQRKTDFWENLIHTSNEEALPLNESSPTAVLICRRALKRRLMSLACAISSSARTPLAAMAWPSAVIGKTPDGPLRPLPYSFPNIFLRAYAVRNV